MIFIMGQLCIVALIYWSIVKLGGELTLEGVFVGISVLFHTLSFVALAVSYDV